MCFQNVRTPFVNMGNFFYLVENSFAFGPLEDSGKLGHGGLGQWPCTLIVVGWMLVVKAGSIHKMAPLQEKQTF